MKGLYKGMSSPLVGQMAFRAALFTTAAESKKYLSNGGTKVSLASLRVVYKTKLSLCVVVVVDNDDDEKVFN
jgi:hypothetical protein